MAQQTVHQRGAGGVACEHWTVVLSGLTPVSGPTLATCEECGATTTDIEFDIDIDNRPICHATFADGESNSVWLPA